MSRLRLAVIGVGHLGKEHARILAGLPDVQLVGVADVDAAQAAAVAGRCGVPFLTDHKPLLQTVDAAVIATPTRYHHAVACDFLRAGIPLLIEKPLAPDAAQAEQLVDLADRHGAVLQVGHIERFNPAFEELRSRPIRPRFVVAQRVGVFTGRSSDIGAVLDLMIHDLDLLLALVPGPVASVEALGLSVLGGHEDMAQARLRFADGCVADLTASRLSLEPCRKMQLWAPEGYAGLDFARRKLTLVQPSEEFRHLRLRPASADAGWKATLAQDLMSRHLRVEEKDCNHGDQLTRELEDFVRCVRTGSRPRVSGADGRDAVVLAGRVLESLRAHVWDAGDPATRGPLAVPPPSGSLLTTPSKAA